MKPEHNHAAETAAPDSVDQRRCCKEHRGRRTLELASWGCPQVFAVHP